MRRLYHGKDIEVTFDLDICIHVAECLRGQRDVFQLDRRAQEDPDATTTITAIRNGPLLVTGKVEVRYQDGTIEALPRATLCRCGESTHKPFCDNSHLAIGFKAPGIPYRIHLSPVRPRLAEPISKEEDPRGH